MTTKANTPCYRRADFSVSGTQIGASALGAGLTGVCGYFIANPLEAPTPTQSKKLCEDDIAQNGAPARSTFTEAVQACIPHKIDAAENFNAMAKGGLVLGIALTLAGAASIGRRYWQCRQANTRDPRPLGHS